ncbi:glycosyltransferase family 9 protein [Microlunatus elymi]|uniref:Glycosyltransferase family 9 protein n=1 Tax=Microlunatus elymi TaxID=2596828 RepID=A0A516Q0A1_9ACTN|nr:glycosyltransferase family 9 protein [Microlunatus elymi]QDP96854.1 glycosyltransferase family 9 protein [Microlunatus elymi]
MVVHLVLRAHGLGDLITAIPALRALRRAWPDDRLLLAAPHGLGPIVQLIDAVDELMPTSGLSEFAFDVRRLGRRGMGHDLEHLDRVINLQDGRRESIDSLSRLQPNQLITYAHPDFPSFPGPTWIPAQQEIDRWCSLLEAFDIDADRTDLRLRRPEQASRYPGAAVIHPGGAFRARRWPPSRFAEVARGLSDEGHQVVITGTPNERKLCCWIAARAGISESAVIAGRTDLGDLAAVISEAAVIICGDTGVGHLATALDTPSVLLFGPTPPSHWEPTSGAAPHIALWAGHVGDPLGIRPDPGLLQLQVDQVLDSARRALQAA